MSKTVTFTCNICKEERSPSDLNGVYFTIEARQPKWEFRQASECHTHICKGCVAIIVELELAKGA